MKTLMTADDLLMLPDDGWRYELVEGRLVRMPPTNLEHSDICGNLYMALRRFVDQRRLGRVTMPETGFTISPPGQPDTVQAPDLAFIQSERLAHLGGRGARTFPRLAPDLVVEIASPSQHRPEMAEKSRLWLSAGVRLVWVVWPARQEVDVWVPESADPRTLGADGVLRGEDVLPGLEIPVSALW